VAAIEGHAKRGGGPAPAGSHGAGRPTYPAESHGAGPPSGADPPGAEGPSLDRGSGNGMPLAGLVSFGAVDGDAQAVRRLGQILDSQRHQPGAAEGAGKSECDQGAVPLAGQGVRAGFQHVADDVGRRCCLGRLIGADNPLDAAQHGADPTPRRPLATGAGSDCVGSGSRQAAGKVRIGADGKRRKHIGRPKVSPETENTIRARLAAGVGILKIASELGVGSGTVQRIKRDAA
jgi:hypothetical protein